jgi:rhamnulokinase
MESLVLRYREVFHSISRQTNILLQAVHVLGGGARNMQLNQWLADALGIPIIVGPYEATALGNALMQLVGLGELHTLEEVRAVAQKTATRVFEPQASVRAVWEEAAQRFSTMTAT